MTNDWRMTVPAVCMMVFGSPAAQACSYAFPPVAETARKIALDGVVIKGTVIQHIDRDKQTSLMIRADTLYVGDRSVSTFIIYYSPIEYAVLADPGAARTTCDHAAVDYPVGYSRIFILEPATSSDNVAIGRWRESMFGSSLLNIRYKPVLIEAATRTGRLLADPPSTQ